MPKLLTADDVKKARRQAAAALGQARQPLYAVLGAGELATEAVRDYVAKARAEAGGQAKDAQSRVADLQARLVELQDRLAEVRTQVRARVGELPEGVAGLRGKFEPAELRYALESYFHSLQGLYERMATRGEVTVEKLRQRQQHQKATARAEDVVTAESVATTESAENLDKVVDKAPDSPGTNPGTPGKTVSATRKTGGRSVTTKATTRGKTGASKPSTKA